MTQPEDPNRVLIFDTTLRDGEQSPGISLNTQEKLEIAQQLARLGVDVIEAGFPITSPGDFEAVQAISRTVEGPVIAGLARTHVADIDAAWNAVKDADAPAHPHVHLDLGHPHRVPAADHARGRQGAGPRRRRARQAVRRGRRVLADGRDPRRHRVHRRGVPDRDRRGRDHDQHPRHRRLHDAARVHRVPGAAVRAGPRPARRRAVGPLPRRPGAGRRQLVRRPAGRRAPGRVRDQRDRRARRQRLARGDRDAAAHARGGRRAAHRRRHPGDRAHLAAGLAPDRLPGAAQQGDRRPQRVRARVRHPPGRRAEGAHHLRDHGRHHGRPRGQLDRARQALGPPRAAAGAGRPGLRGLRPGPEHRVQALQGDRGQEEAGHRDGSRGAASPTSCARRSPATSSSGSTSRPRRAGRRTRRSASARPDGEEVTGSFTGDGPVDAIFRAINAATGTDARLREFRVDAVTGGQDALGETSVVLEVGGVTGSGQGVSTDILEAAGPRVRARAVERDPPARDHGRGRGSDGCGGRRRRTA